MSQSLNVDYLIVGQGLAGSAVGVHLIQEGRKILVIDNAQRNTSSNIAAGMFNPITGKKMLKTWKADVLFPYLHTFYTMVEGLTEKRFFYPAPVYRPFISVQEQNEWMAESEDALLKAYLKEIRTGPIQNGILCDTFGGLLLKQCGYLDTTSYISSVRDWLERKGAHFQTDFDPSSLEIGKTAVSYNGIQAKAVIFCEGEHVTNNELFRWLPVRTLKGETLTIQAALPSGLLVNRGVYIVPDRRKDCWRVGATYEHNATLRDVTDEARVQLEQKLREVLRVPYTVAGQDWGMRPTTPDRRPLLGAHPVHQNVVIFNGLGTKGVSLAPYFSKVLVDWLEKGISLDKEVDISRYKSLY